MDQNTRIAIDKFFNGEPYKVSTGIHDMLTYGYGELDDNGFWEYEIPSWIVNAISNEERVEDLERTLRKISLYSFNIDRDCQEGDKVMCGTGQIRSLITSKHPVCDWPYHEKDIYDELKNGKKYYQIANNSLSR